MTRSALHRGGIGYSSSWLMLMAMVDNDDDNDNGDNGDDGDSDKDDDDDDDELEHFLQGSLSPPFFDSSRFSAQIGQSGKKSPFFNIFINF